MLHKLTRFFALVGLFFYLIASLQIPFFQHYCMDNLVSVMPYSVSACGAQRAEREIPNPDQDSRTDQLFAGSCCHTEVLNSGSEDHVGSDLELVLENNAVPTLLPELPTIVAFVDHRNAGQPVLRPPPLKRSNQLALIQAYLI